MSASSLLAAVPWSTILSSGVIGIALGAWLNHGFAARREAAKDLRERQRDRERDERDRQRELEREDRERQREKEREKAASDQERAVVNAELVERIRSHCAALRPWLIQTNPQTPGWNAANQELLSRADSDRVRRALGEQYLDLMDAIRYESKSILIQQKMQDEAVTKILDANQERLPHADIEEHYFRAQSLENVADVLARYAPLISAFGDPEYGEEIRHAAETGRARAMMKLSRDPTSL